MIKKNNIRLIFFTSISFILMLVMLMKGTYVSIIYKTVDNGSIKIYYDNKTENYFDELNTSISNVIKDSDNFHELNIKVPIDKLGKLRLDFENINNISLVNISIKSIGFTLKNYSINNIQQNFIITNDCDIKTNENTVDIISSGNDCYIGINSINKTNIIKVIVIIAFVLSIIISLVIIKLLSILKLDNSFINKENIIISIFVLSLIIPNVYFFIPDIKENNNTENRVLANKPALNLMNINDYPKQFEQFYTDNLPFKTSLVKLNSILKWYTFDNSPQDYVIKGKDDWLFYNSKYRNDEDTMADFKGTNYLDTTELDLFIDKLEYMNSVCKSNGSEFYLYIAPNKSTIYDEYMPIRFGSKAEESKTDKIVEYIKTKTDINVIYPKDALLELKKKYQLYYKLDTHWNNLGAYVGYTELMKILDNKNLPSLEQIDIKSEVRVGGDLANMVGMNDILKENDYFIENISDINTELVESDESGRTFLRYKSTNTNNKKLLAFRDSFFSSIIPYISTDFTESVFVWYKKFDQELIKKEKPDVVIMESVERLIEQIHY